MLLIHPNSMKLNHDGSASVKVIVRWLVLVKTYGNSPRKLLNRINENGDTNRNVPPLFFLFFPISVLNSLCSFVINEFHAIVCREGTNHILVGMSVSPIMVPSQLSGNGVLVDGSNTEKRLLIIFNLMFLLLLSFWWWFLFL
jgi:hypothetical protein